MYANRCIVSSCIWVQQRCPLLQGRLTFFENWHINNVFIHCICLHLQTTINDTRDFVDVIRLHHVSEKQTLASAISVTLEVSSLASVNNLKASATIPRIPITLSPRPAMQGSVSGMHESSFTTDQYDSNIIHSTTLMCF
jgi:hypothetical protein